MRFQQNMYRSFILIWIITPIVSSIYIDYLTTRKNGQAGENSGSTEGGTLLWIYGDGFLRPRFQSNPTDVVLNRVQFYRPNENPIYDCLMYPDEITTTQLACYTPPIPEGYYQLRIYVNETLLNSSAYYQPDATVFRSTPSSTPKITSISPITGPPRRILTISGDFKTSCYSRDTPACSSESTPLISRIHVGSQLCNLINPQTRTLYAPVTNTTLQCRIEGDEVGLFNVTIIVTNGYGRSKVDECLIRISSTGQRYTVEAYSTLSSITPANGSESGGSQLTLAGTFFSQNDETPLVISVGDVPCPVIRWNSTTIECQISKRTTNNRTNYAGNRGCHIFTDSSFIDLNNLVNGTIPMPNTTTSRIWSNDASHRSTSTARGTVWIIGYIRPTLTATYKFQLTTETNTLFYLSSDDNPLNKNLIANYTSLTSQEIRLEKDKNYYFLCISSKSGETLFNLFIGITIVEPSSLGGNEIQKIDIGRDLVDEHQRIIYSKNISMNSLQEIQDIPTITHPFQIGFRGVYTSLLDYPSAAILERALNDLPTIYPLQVTVTLFTSYRIRFPIEMGDVPLLTIISSFNTNQDNVTVIQQGIADGSRIAFELDGSTTNYVDFSADIPPTNVMLENELKSLFAIRCPSSLIDKAADPSIVYADDFETSSIYYNTVNDLLTNAFCGRSSTTNGWLIPSNDEEAEYLCFAYMLTVSTTITMNFSVQDDGDPPTITSEYISIHVQNDNRWHYKCLELRAMLEQHSQNYWIVNSFKIKSISFDTHGDLKIDTISLRLSLPLGYENEGSLSSRDQSTTSSSCQFPFTYNGVQYHRCARGPNDLPICQIATNQFVRCQSSSIEGVRRLFPRFQLANNQFTVQHSIDNQTIDIVYRYTNCDTGALIQVHPASNGYIISISTSPPSISGTYDLIYRNQTYSSIPVKMTSDDFANLLQSFDHLGYVNVVTLFDQCYKSSYRIQWINKGPQDLLSLSNTQNNNTPIFITSIQRGYIDNTYYHLPRVLLRTDHISPQVTVTVDGYAAYCTGSNNNCAFRYASDQTPKIFSIDQNQTMLIIRGDGFDPSIQRNTVLIGQNGQCDIISCNRTSIICQIIRSPCGQHLVDVNVIGKGFASTNRTMTVNASLLINSIAPVQGTAGGGYPLAINGTGFSTNTKIFIDDQLCPMISLIDFSFLTCLVPLSTRTNTVAVNIVAIDGTYSVTRPTSFTYTMTNVPTLATIYPSFVTMQGGVVNITGSALGNGSISVWIADRSAQVLAFTSTSILIDVPRLPPGLYPIRVNTSMGFARPMLQLEYRFYFQSISPQIGSITGGTRLTIQGQGFDNTTQVRFRDDNNQEYPCSTQSRSSTTIQCQTESFQAEVAIEPTDVHPIFGSGYAWSPSHVTVEQGTRVSWHWNSSNQIRSLRYKVQQVSTAYSTDPLSNGFDSGSSTTTGSFSSVMNTLGKIYYWSSNIDPQGLDVSIRGVITVVPTQSRQLTVIVSSSSYEAQTCVFPFIFNSINYTTCTRDNDTQLWCSPTSIYEGQRLYCSSTNSLSNNSCSFSTLNLTMCNPTQARPMNQNQFFASSCGLETILSMSPIIGTVGTYLNFTGDYFDGSPCEYDIEIGSFYRCPVTSVTSTTLTCQIDNTTRLFSQPIGHLVRVHRLGRGYLKSYNELQFSFQTAITQISPTIGSMAGGTQVTIDGFGFQPGLTLVFIAGHTYSNFTFLNYSRLSFITDSRNTYVDMDLPMNVTVNGLDGSVCLSSSCSFAWKSSVTPQFNSVQPSSISAATDLTIFGANFLGGQNLSMNGTSAHIFINDYVCQVTGMTDTQINCSINTLERGDHLITGTIDGLGHTQSSLYLTSNAMIDHISPTISSVYGGGPLIILGNGFSKNRSNLEVIVDGNPCVIITSDPGQIHCTIPSQSTSSDRVSIEVISSGLSIPPMFYLNYSQDVTPIITSVISQIQISLIQLNITGRNFLLGNTSVRVGRTSCPIMSMSSTSIVCFMPKNLSAGYHPIIVHVDIFGDSNANVTYQQTLQINTTSPDQGSWAGGLPIIITGNGFAGMNVTVLVCNRSCSSIEIKSNQEVICVTPSMSPRITNDHICNVTLTVDGITRSTMFTYRNNLTGNITSISPMRGGTGGNTTVTIIGRDFIISNKTKVTIGGVSCRIRTINSTAIICSTGSISRANLAATVLVFIDGRGYADGSITYQYMDLWSSRWTWDGQTPPESGSLVNVTGGVTLFLDISTPILKVLLIDNATLIFDDSQDLQLNVEYILIINGGRLQIGTESQPFQHRAEINLYGDQLSTELPIYGAKVFAIREGTVDMHGTSRIRTWTRLGMTVLQGSSILQLTDPIDWPINSDIVIATTGDRFSQEECEQRRILNISSDGLTVTLNEPLKYKHLGLTQQLNTTITLQIRAEVGLLSHNIIIQGISSSTLNSSVRACPEDFTPEEAIMAKCALPRFTDDFGLDQFGATIMISPDLDQISSQQRIILRLSNIEMFNVGQAYRVNRYPVNFYRNGNMSFSYIKSCSIHSSSNQAMHIEATDSLTIDNNVIFNVMGRAILLQDGIEMDHVFRNNLILGLQSSSYAINDDFTPAAFWLTNPNNVLEGNAVAASSHAGYQYNLLASVTGLSNQFNPSYRPDREVFGRFINNTVHSCGTYGLRLAPQYIPIVSNANNTHNMSQVMFQGLVSWKNEKGMEYDRARIIQIKEAIIFDNSDTGIACLSAVDYQQADSIAQSIFYNSENGSFVRDSWIIGDSQTSSSPVIPSNGGLIVMWDRGLLIDNVTFINFHTNTTPAISSAPMPDICTSACVGWTTKFSHISFVNVVLRGRFRQSYDGVYEDLDGSLTGVNRSVLVAPNDLTHNRTSCTSTPLFDNTFQCSAEQGSWLRFEYVEFVDRTFLLVSNTYNRSTTVSYGNDPYSNPHGYTLVLQANQTYRLSFSSLDNWFSINYNLLIYDMSPKDYFIIEHVVQEEPHGAFDNLATSLLDPATAEHLDWDYNSNNSVLSYIIRGSSNSSSGQTRKVAFSLFRCPYCSFCTCPTTTTTTATTSTTTTATTSTTTTATTSTTTTATSSTSTSATTTTTTTETTTTATTQTTTSAMITTTENCSPYCIRYWSRDADWSSIQVDSTWSAQKPTNDQDIFVPENITLIIDYPLPRIHTLKISGQVIFQDGLNHTMYVDSIYLSFGKLIAGSVNQPFNGQIDIFMTNTRPVNISIHENLPSAELRSITVVGALELYGQTNYPVWTRLAQTARAGDTLITVRQTISWSVGDEIVITTTDAHLSHTERHRIAQILNGTTLQLANPLAHNHLVIQQVFPNGQQVDIAAAVGRLTRNIRIQSVTPSSSLSGFNIYITDPLFPFLSRRSKLRLSHVQLIGFGIFNDYVNERFAGIYIYNLRTILPSLVAIDGCVFVDGFNTAIELRSANSLSITNNIIYKTYKSGIVFGGRNNMIENNLITTIYWSGTAQSTIAQSMNMNFDAAIHARKAISVILRNNLVAGIERVAYLIVGAACDPTIAPSNITNIYENNEAHSVQSGVNIWPNNATFAYDRECVLITGFTVYKASYHGYYITSRRNITINSCVSIENQVGFFTFIIGLAPENHRLNPNRIIILNSLIIGSLNIDNCTDDINLNENNAVYSNHAQVKLPFDYNARTISGRAGIITSTISSKKPATTVGSWTEPRAYPCNDGLMIVRNVTLAYFNDICNRHDVAFQTSQINNDIQFPIRTELISSYNVSDFNVMYNGFPNSDAISKRSCRGMDCDGLKAVLLMNPDGTLFNRSTSMFSWDNAYWNNNEHGVADLLFPSLLKSYFFQERIDIATRYPLRGAGRTNSCVLQQPMGMYKCANTSDYRLMMVEIMDTDASVSLFPITVLSDIGSINLISGPQSQLNSTSAPSIFTMIVQSGQNYTLFFKTGTAKHLRFRVIDGVSSFKCIISVAYTSSPQIDIYADSNYMAPTNRDPLSSTLSLVDRPNGVAFNSTAGTNYFERRFNWQYFLIDGNTMIDVKVSPKIFIVFPLPPTNFSSFYQADVAWKLSILLGVHPNKIRNVRIIASEDGSAKRRRRQDVSYTLAFEIREEPQTTTSSDSGVRAAVVANIASSIVSRVHSGDIYTSWQHIGVIANVTPTSVKIQEPFQETSKDLQIISRIVLKTPPSDCREYTPCAIQPVIVAYNPSNQIIEKLGSVERPWQIKATLVNQPNVVLSGGIGDYLDGETRFTRLSLPSMGSYQIQFTFVQPDGFNSTFLQSANFTLRTGSISVTSAMIDGEEINHTAVVNLAEKFSLFVRPIDKITRLPLAKIQWSNWTWKGNASFYQLPKFNRAAASDSLGNTNVTVELTKNRICIGGLSINVTGMFIVNIRLVSSHNLHSINILSKALLVTDDLESLSTDTSDLLSNITYNETAGNRISTTDAEVRRAMIYNQLINLGMPLVSDVTLLDENRIVLFQVGTAADRTSRAVSSILSNPGDVPSLTTTSVNINGRSFFPTFSIPSTTNSNKPSTSGVTSNHNNNNNNNNTGLIVGLVVGLVGGLIIVTTIILITRARNKAGCRSEPYRVPAEEEDQSMEIEPMPQITSQEGSQIPIQLLGSPTNYPSAPTSPHYNRRVYRLPPLFSNEDQ